MARYRPVAHHPCFLPVVQAEQLLPGTFEFAPNHLIDSGAVPLDGFDAHDRNDEVGAAWPIQRRAQNKRRPPGAPLFLCG